MDGSAVRRFRHHLDGVANRDFAAGDHTGHDAEAARGGLLRLHLNRFEAGANSPGNPHLDDGGTESEASTPHQRGRDQGRR